MDLIVNFGGYKDEEELKMDGEEGGVLVFTILIQGCNRKRIQEGRGVKTTFLDF